MKLFGLEIAFSKNLDALRNSLRDAQEEAFEYGKENQSLLDNVSRLLGEKRELTNKLFNFDAIKNELELLKVEYSDKETSYNTLLDKETEYILEIERLSETLNTRAEELKDAQNIAKSLQFSLDTERKKVKSGNDRYDSLKKTNEAYKSTSIALRSERDMYKGLVDKLTQERNEVTKELEDLRAFKEKAEAARERHNENRRRRRASGKKN